MSLGLKLVCRVALFSALAYVLSWATSYLPNVNLIFFVAFAAGLLWGILPGMLVGGIGMGLWTILNPYGPAHPYLMVTQVVAMSISGAVGGLFARTGWRTRERGPLSIMLAACGLLCAALFFLPVSAVDAWLFGPFWPRFATGLLWALVSVGANMLVFPLLFGVVQYLSLRETQPV
jgi:hypothetical protein